MLELSHRSDAEFCSESIFPTDAESFLDQGVQQHLAGNLQGAIACYDQALAIKPDYHDALSNKGVALSDLGDKLAAIACYDQALAIKPDYHDALSNKGNVLSDLGDYSVAIACYDQALAIKPDYHATLSNKGTALYHLGDYSVAIACYDQALTIKPDYHGALYNKGITLSDSGNKLAAIACYDQALTIKPDYHGALYNKGNTLSDLGDYSVAIACYDQALAIKSDDHATLCNKGLALYHLGDYSVAIACYDQALAIKPDDHEALCNKGNALYHLGDYSVAIACYDQALAIKPNYHIGWLNKSQLLYQLQLYVDAVANYQKGLNHIHSNTQPKELGILHHGMGRLHHHDFRGRFNFHPKIFDSTISYYHAALKTLTPNAFPKNHLEVVQDLIRIHLDANDQQEADRWLEEGLEVFRQLINQATDTQRLQLETEFASFSQVRIDVLVQAGKNITALETADRYKNRCLTWILDEWQKQEQEQEQAISPSYAKIRQLLNDSTAIVYWHLSPDALTTFLLLPTESEPQVLDSDRATLLHRHRDFEAWRKDWDKQYQDYRPKKASAIDKANHPWRKTLGDRLNQLQQILNIPAVEQQLSGITHLILIPHRDLHRFPLHALFSQSFTCTYLPSIQIGLALQTRSTPNLPTATLLSVEDPSGQDEMLYARIESAVIRQLFTKVTPIASAEATPTAVTTALSQGYDLFHFTGHGEHDDRQPQNSAIGLANETRLTAKEINALPLQTCYLASIAACETAVTGQQAIDTEYVGLVSAFLRAGTAHVISTLWNVEEIASSWLMIRFYQLLSAGNAPTLAFQQAQQWFRSITPVQLADWLCQLSQLPGLDPGIQEYLEQEADRLTADTSPIDTSPIDSSTMNSNHPIYAHPYYWAAFTLTGRAN